MKKLLLNFIVLSLSASFLMTSCNNDDTKDDSGKNQITFKTNSLEKTYEIKYYEGGAAAPAVIIGLGGTINSSPYTIDLKFFTYQDHPNTGKHAISPVESNDGKVKCTLNHNFTELGISKNLVATAGEVNFIQYKSEGKKAKFTFEATFYEVDNLSQPIEGGQTNIKVSASIN